MRRTTLAVEGMSCDGCVRSVQNALRTLGGVTRVEADHESGTVELVATDDVDEGTIAAAVHDAGFEVAG